MLNLLLILLTMTAHAKFEVPGFELVYTAPVETKLSAGELRDPVTVWVELIDNAKKEVQLEHFYISGKDGEPLDQVIAALARATERGVKVKFLIEEKSLRGASMPETVAKVKAIKGLEFRAIDWAKLMGDGIIHAKFMQVDGKFAYVGSQNFDWRALKHIDETGLLISDKTIVAQIKAIMDHDWKAADLVAKGKKVPVLNKKSMPANHSARAYLVASPNAYNPKGVGDSEVELPRLLAEAKEEIRIQVMDYYPLNRDKTFYPIIDNAIRAAQARKVKIKLMVGHWSQSKPGVDHLKSLALLPGIEVKIVTLPRAKEGFIPFSRVIHSKNLLIDGKTAWVGTSNWTGGYFDKSRNLEVIVRDEKLAKRMVEKHEMVWTSEHAEKIDIDREYPKPEKGEPVSK
jgi:phosphatidylserine/phosphatidylglycerophosphate/cardiolipin synthase-like enzyme